MDPNRLLQQIGRTPGAAALVLAGLILAPSAAHASTAANTVITNVASVDFKDAGGTAQPTVTAQASVTVLLVPAAPTITPSTTTASTNQGSSTTITYTITSNANGLDTYNLSTGDTLTNDTGGTATVAPTSVSLGGTTLAAATTGTSTIFVPYDNTTNGNINGIVAGSTIVIAGVAYPVASITENTGSNASTIVIGGAVFPPAGLLAGIIVGQQTTVTVTVTSGTVTGAGNTGTEVVNLTGASNTTPAQTTTSTNTTVTVNRAVLTVTKTVATDGGVTGTSFSATGATAVPGTALTYRVVAFNGGSADATSVTFTDALPPYLTYVPGSGRSATAASLAAASALVYGGTTLTEGSGGYTFTTNTVKYSPPSPGLGTVTSNTALVLFFKATIN